MESERLTDPKNTPLHRLPRTTHRFNPGSYTSWLGLAERAWQLFLVYLDHAPAFTPREPPVATAFDRLLRGRTTTTTQDGSAVAPPPSLAPFLAPFLSPAAAPEGPGARVAEILRGMGLGAELLAPLGADEAAQAQALEEGGVWAAVVCAAYRVLAERALLVLGPVLEGYVGLAGSSAQDDKELLQKQVGCCECVWCCCCLSLLLMIALDLSHSSSHIYTSISPQQIKNRWRPASAWRRWRSSGAMTSLAVPVLLVAVTRRSHSCSTDCSTRPWRTRRRHRCERLVS